MQKWNTKQELSLPRPEEDFHNNAPFKPAGTRSSVGLVTALRLLAGCLLAFGAAGEGLAVDGLALGLATGRILVAPPGGLPLALAAAIALVLEVDGAGVTRLEPLERAGLDRLTAALTPALGPAGLVVDEEGRTLATLGVDGPGVSLFRLTPCRQRDR